MKHNEKVLFRVALFQCFHVTMAPPCLLNQLLPIFTMESNLQLEILGCKLILCTLVSDLSGHIHGFMALDHYACGKTGLSASWLHGIYAQVLSLASVLDESLVDYACAALHPSCSYVRSKGIARYKKKKKEKILWMLHVFQMCHISPVYTGILVSGDKNKMKKRKKKKRKREKRVKSNVS